MNALCRRSRSHTSSNHLFSEGEEGRVNRKRSILDVVRDVVLLKVLPKEAGRLAAPTTRILNQNMRTSVKV
jgi:hypothetical protein